MAQSDDKIIVLIDMDCFFCQVEEREHPELRGKPLVVTQYNLVLAVNYEAKIAGVKRFLRPDEAKAEYPELNTVSVPISRGKGDVSKYRAAGHEVIELLKQHCPLIERASVDEAYLDITNLVDEKMESMTCARELISRLKNTFVVGYCDEDSNDEQKRLEGLETWIKNSFDNLGDIQAQKLALAGLIVEEFRAEILEKTQFRCSAGISYNKALAKLACGLHKPNKQTILPAASVPDFFSTLPINKVRNWGGKTGKEVIENLGCKVMADLLKFSLQDLQKHFDEKTSLRLFNIARGVDNEALMPRIMSKSIGASKNFSVKAAITDLDILKKWVTDLSEDMVMRLERDSKENRRRATTLVISYQFVQAKKTVSQSRTFPLVNYKADRIIKQAFDLISKSIDKPIVGVSISASKFVDDEKNGKNFINYFKAKNDVDQTQIVSQIAELSQFDDNSNEFPEIPEISDENQLSTSDEENKKNDDQETSNEQLEKIQPVQETKMLFDKPSKLSQLQEIFPELDKIDPTVLKLLPLELQKTAEDYLNSRNGIKNLKIVQQPATKSRNNSPKRKEKIKNNNIKNFFINSPSSSSLAMIKCSECDQMIQDDKYPEHVDFHVAQNLQRNLNRLNNDVENCEKRNRESGNTPKARKKLRGIESYFCSNK